MSDSYPENYHQDLSSDFAPDSSGNDDQLDGPTPEQQQQQAAEALAQQAPPAQQQQAPAQGLPPDLMRILQEHGQMSAQLAAMQGQQQAPQQQGNPDDLVTMGQVQQWQQQQSVQQRQALDDQRLQMSVQMVSQQMPDYKQQVAKLQDPGIHPYINFAAIQQSPNPALVAYQIAKAFATPGELQAAATQEAAKLAPSVTPQSPQGPRTLNTLPAAAAPQAPAKVANYSDRSPRELAKLSDDERRALYVKQLQG